MKTKQCSKCGITLPIKLFHKDSTKSDGYYSSCKSCNSKNDGIRNQAYFPPKERYWLNKLMNTNYNNVHYQKHKKYYNAKRAKIQQNLGYEEKYPNIIGEPIEWHHINNREVVAVPKDLHRLYCTNNREEHRENMKYIVKQLYGGD